MKKKLLTILLVLSIITFSITTIYAADGGLLLASSGFEEQEKSNWCWVACARNSVHHETSNHRTQKAAVMHIKGGILNWYPNVKGTIADIEEAAEYISKDTESYTSENAKFAFSKFKEQVEYSNATIACAALYDSDGERVTGHCMLVIGYYISGNNNYLVYHDPANNSTYTCLFSEFLNGSFNGKKYEATCYNTETS